MDRWIIQYPQKFFGVYRCHHEPSFGYCTQFVTKKTLNEDISTKRKIVGSHDGIIMVLWCKYFIESQGYTMAHIKFYQDNKSNILIDKK